MNALEKLRSVVDDIKSPKNPASLHPNWQLAARLVTRFPTDQAAAANACSERDISALDAIVAALENPPEEHTASAVEISPTELNDAMRAFRKRIKLARLSDESRLGGRYTSTGRTSNIDAIEPPREFPLAVWKALVRDGRLTNTGHGFYAETNPKPTN